MDPDFELREWYIHGDLVVGKIYDDLSGTYPDGHWVNMTNIKSNTHYKDHNIIVFGKERDFYCIAYTKHKLINGG